MGKDVKVVRNGLGSPTYTSHTINHEKLHAQVLVSGDKKGLERMTCQVTRQKNTTNFYIMKFKVNGVEIDIRINHI